MKIADHNKDSKSSQEYAYRILKEPNVSPLHRGAALYRLSQFAFSMNKKILFDSVYNELQALKNTEGLEAIEPIVEVNNLVMAGKYDEALHVCEKLSPENRAERMAIIYHRMGNNMRAYEYMSKFKEIHDSIMLVSQGNLVATFFMQMSNDRLNLEQKILKEENANLRLIIYYFNVTDMGCGISPELREHIFDTFVEIGGSPKLNGLGLPICKAITKLCGGDIWIDTSYTEGARFIVEMPQNATLRERAQSADE